MRYTAQTCDGFFFSFFFCTDVFIPFEIYPGVVVCVNQIEYPNIEVHVCLSRFTAVILWEMYKSWVNTYLYTIYNDERHQDRNGSVRKLKKNV